MRSSILLLASVTLLAQSPPPTATESAPVRLNTERQPSFGPPDAPVTIVEFGDFECPSCRAEAPLLRELIPQLYPDKIRIGDVGFGFGTPFGRTPVVELGGAGTHAGRDHNPHGFTALLAGGGFKPGHVHGATDEFGYRAVTDRMSVPDLMATVLNQLGLDHARLS